MVHKVNKKELWVAVTLDLSSFDSVVWQSCSNDYVIHPNYKPKQPRDEHPNYDHDIALVKILLEPIKISGEIVNVLMLSINQIQIRSSFC